jgi:SAM-dependent methyltransferase
MVHVLTTVLFGRSLPLALLPHRPELRGIGMSDWNGYATALASKLDYLNTYYHREPRFDVTAPPPAAASFDFLISSDVFEHVAPPIERAFANVLKLLRPGGHLVFTVPYALTGETMEHFPELHDYDLLDFRGTRILVNRTRDGRLQVFENLCFHGGEGDTLEMRLFARPALVRHLTAAGFTDIRFWGEPYLAHGIYWSSPLSLPITARRPA